MRMTFTILLKHLSLVREIWLGRPIILMINKKGKLKKLKRGEHPQPLILKKLHEKNRMIYAYKLIWLEIMKQPKDLKMLKRYI